MNANFALPLFLSLPLSLSLSLSLSFFRIESFEPDETLQSFRKCFARCKRLDIRIKVRCRCHRRTRVSARFNWDQKKARDIKRTTNALPVTWAGSADLIPEFFAPLRK